MLDYMKSGITEISIEELEETLKKEDILETIRRQWKVSYFLYLNFPLISTSLKNPSSCYNFFPVTRKLLFTYTFSQLWFESL